ncbi:MAG TPA: alpha/beta hydrolase [Desulfomonilaceae bacterium]|nr:alpha/beta hydrolase [Desulfomonilaceae bacterium]
MNFVKDMLDGFIESQIFFPDRTLMCTPATEGLTYQDMWFETSDAIRLHGWLIPAVPSIGLVLFCHGNAGNVSHRVDNIRLLNEIGVSVFIFDYRGYGMSNGRITETGFYLDAEAAFAVARGLANRDSAQLIVFGRSLGGIAAVHLAARHVCDGVILESTFPHLAALAKEHFPLPAPENLLKHRLNAVDKIGNVKADILFFHGDRDTIVPIRLGRQLFSAASAHKEFVVLSGAEHNDTYLVGGRKYFDKWKTFIAGLRHHAPSVE